MASQPPPEAKSLPNPPSDGITALSYFSTIASSHLASTSWDGSVRIHDTSAQSAKVCQSMESGPLLSLATLSSSFAAVTGGLDGSSKSRS